MPPREHRPELPAYLERVILDLLAKEPGERPGDARELARRISAHRAAPAYVPTVVAARPAPDALAHAGRLPSWTHGMTTGHKAAGAGLRSTPPDPASGLSGEWIARPATGPVGEPAPEQRPAPSPEVLTALAGRHNAGLSLGRLGRWAEAGEVHRAVAAEREHLLGPDHPDTLASRYEVAFTLSRTGRAPDAPRGRGHRPDRRRRGHRRRPPPAW
ncbi:tRNA A-37 threonylcarbamoyl transferase component Bud32/tetratricopeptide (TPR) repeat protein OS=Streptomyces violarus OX=67380 GN=FHS41_005478 PE=4 SV=1 [Streptomyces violarus]